MPKAAREKIADNKVEDRKIGIKLKWRGTKKWKKEK